DAESTLTSRQGDLESLQAQRSSLADQVEMSTLTISLTTEPVAVDDEKSGFLDGLRTGWDALLSTLSAIVVVLGVSVPWLVVGAVGLGAARWVRRRLRRRRGAVRTPVPTGEADARADEPRAGVPTR